MRTLLDESSTRRWWESKVIGHGSANACVWLQVSDQNAFAIFVLEMWLSACVCVFIFVGLGWRFNQVMFEHGMVCEFMCASVWLTCAIRLRYGGTSAALAKHAPLRGKSQVPLR